MTSHGREQTAAGNPPGTSSSLPATAARGGAHRHVAALRTKLEIAGHQLAAWQRFADSLYANQHRMQAFDEETDPPFGSLEDRLAARDAMMRAAADLFAVLGSAQQRMAAQLLPLCCLPHAPVHERFKRNRIETSTTTTDLIRELERNADYYCAGPDREAGQLLRRAAEALVNHL